MGLCSSPLEPYFGAYTGDEEGLDFIVGRLMHYMDLGGLAGTIRTES